MTTKTIPAYLEDERQKGRDAQLRMEQEAARIEPLDYGHHRTAKQPTLELPSVLETVPKARRTVAAVRKEPRTARKKATNARKRRDFRGCARGQDMAGAMGSSIASSLLGGRVC